MLRRITLVAVIAFCLWQAAFTQAQAQTALGKLAASMPPGTWAELTNTNASAVFGHQNPNGATKNHLAYTDELVWDPTTRKAFFIGNDHFYTIDTNYTIFAAYSDATNAWQLLPQPSWVHPQGGAHAYDHHAINPATGDLYYRIGNQAPGAGEMYKRTASTGTWSPIAHPFGRIDDSGQAVDAWPTCCVGFEYFPELKGLVYVDNGAVWFRNESTGQWSQLASGLVMGGLWYFTEYDPIHKILLFGGGDYPASKAIYKLDATGKVTRLKDAPAFINAWDLQGQATVLTADPVSGKFLLLTNTAFYAYDVTTDTWAALNSSAVPVRTSSGMFGVAATPVSTYGVTMFVSCELDTCKVYLYKHSGSTPPPPPPSDTTPPTVALSAPTAGATVSGTVTVAATAADNVGVAGVQFRLDGANLGAEDTTAPYALSWNTAQTPNGTHTLTARARDAAGNQTTSAAITVTVNNQTPPPPPPPPPPASLGPLPEPPLALPTPGVTYTDPTFGTPTLRIMDAKAKGYGLMVPEYAQLQAWNADMTRLLVRTGNGWIIVDAQTFQVLHTVDFHWPAWGQGLRWSPVDPTVLYYTGGLEAGYADPDAIPCGVNQARLMRYRLLPSSPLTARRELVRCFAEYTAFDRDASFEAPSDDGRYIALVGLRPDGASDIFAYDIPNNIKHTALKTSTGLDRAAMAPSGRYVLIGWGGGAPMRYWGLEAFDLEMQYLGKVHTGSASHSDLTRDSDGTDVAILTNANNAYLLTEQNYLVKARIPNGVILDSSGNVDEQATVGSGATVPLLVLDWFHNMHISCRNSRARGWCIVSTYSTQESYDNGWQAFEDEIFKVYLDSQAAAPHVARLAHHRSQMGPYIQNGCSVEANYWAQPHATVSPDGTEVIYGSNWRRVCDAASPVDAFILILGGPPPLSAPTGLTGTVK